jgi:hypothetical protein
VKLRSKVTVIFRDTHGNDQKMNWGQPEIIVARSAQPGLYVVESTRDVPVDLTKRLFMPNVLPAHYGGHRHTAKNAPHDFTGWNPMLGPHKFHTDDTLAFGGHSGGNFLVRNVRQ